MKLSQIISGILFLTLLFNCQSNNTNEIAAKTDAINGSFSKTSSAHKKDNSDQLDGHKLSIPHKDAAILDFLANQQI